MERGLAVLLFEPLTLYLCIYYIVKDEHIKFSDILIWQFGVGIVAQLIAMVPILIFQPSEDKTSISGLLILLFYLGTHITIMQFVIERFGVIETEHKIVILTIFYVSRVMIIIIYFAFINKMLTW